jgi:hypothetical protein
LRGKIGAGNPMRYVKCRRIAGKLASYDLSHHAQLGQIRNDDAFRYANRHSDVYFDGTHSEAVSFLRAVELSSNFSPFFAMHIDKKHSLHCGADQVQSLPP